MRLLLSTVVMASLVGLASLAHSQTAVPGSTLPGEKVALNTVQVGADVVKAGAMRLDTSSRRGPTSVASKAADRDEGEHPLRMASAALLLMVAIAVRRFRSGKP